MRTRSAPTTGRSSTSAARDPSRLPSRSPFRVRSKESRDSTAPKTVARTSSPDAAGTRTPRRSGTSSPIADHAGWPRRTIEPDGAAPEGVARVGEEPERGRESDHEREEAAAERPRRTPAPRLTGTVA